MQPKKDGGDGVGKNMIGWIKNLPTALRYYYHSADLKRMEKEADIATHREYIQRTMTQEIYDEYKRYIDSVDLDCNDWKSKVSHHLRPEMEEEDRICIRIARLEHLMFMAQSMLHQAQKSVKLAEERAKATSLAANECRRLQLETEKRCEK